jgi:hypothetical protein
MSVFPDPPNPRQLTAYDPDDDEILLAELAYSPMFRRFLELVIVPRIKDLRDKLLRNQELPEIERRGYVIHLLELEKMILRVYETTEAETAPAWVVALFH